MNPIHELANRYHKYLTNAKAWIDRNNLIKVATSHGYTQSEAIEGLTLLEENIYPYDYCDLARRTREGKGQYRVWSLTTEEDSKKREHLEWFDMLSNAEPAPIISEDTRPTFGKPHVKRKR